MVIVVLREGGKSHHQWFGHHVELDGNFLYLDEIVTQVTAAQASC